MSRLKTGVEEASPAVQKLLTRSERGTELPRTVDIEGVPNLVSKTLQAREAPTVSRGLAAKAEEIRASQLISDRERAVIDRYQKGTHSKADENILRKMRDRLGTGRKGGGEVEAEAPPITGFEQSNMPGGGLGGPRKPFSGPKATTLPTPPSQIDQKALQELLEAYRSITRTPVTPHPVPPEAAGYRSLIPRRSYETELPPSPSVTKE